MFLLRNLVSMAKFWSNKIVKKRTDRNGNKLKIFKRIQEVYLSTKHNFWYHWIWILPSIGRGCASVLNTYLSNGIVELSPNSKYKYLRVSPRKNVSILSLLRGGTVVTSSSDVYPPLLTFVCLSNASKISHPHARYLQCVHISIFPFFSHPMWINETQLMI